MAESFSRDRYRSWAEPMNRAWQAALPLIQIFDWGGWCTRPKEDPLYAHYAYMWQRSGNFMSDMLGIRELRVFAPEMIRCWEYTLSRALPYQKNVRDVLETLASLPDEALADAFVKRDAVDLARSLVEQRIHHGLMRLTNEIYAWQQGAENADAIRARIRPLLEAACRHAEIIGCQKIIHKFYGSLLFFPVFRREIRILEILDYHSSADPFSKMIQEYICFFLLHAI